MAGKLLIFEGPDGVGKTTLIQNISDFLQGSAIPFINLSFPGKTPGTLGHLVDRLHHAREELEVTEITPLALQALHIAAHLDAIETRIKPALKNGTTVLLDRTWWSTWVYGKANHVSEAVLAKLIDAEKLCWSDSKPSLVFLIQRAAAFRAEHSQERFNTLSNLYEELAALEEIRHPVIRISNDDLEVSIDMIRQAISSVFNMQPSK